MIKDSFEKYVERVLEVNEVIKKLEPTIQENVYKLLEPYITGGKPAPAQNKHDDEDDGIDDTDTELSALVAKAEDDKPAYNAKLVAAYHFSQYGKEPFSLDDLRDIAKDAGLTIPDRLDATISTTKSNKKKLFQSVKNGVYKPTATGETYLKNTFGVKKGTKTKPESDK